MPCIRVTVSCLKIRNLPPLFQRQESRLSVRRSVRLPRWATRSITAQSLRKAFNASRDRAGLGRDVTFHCLRHAVATYLHECGAETSVVQDLLGHKSQDATRVYARTTGAMFRRLDHPVAAFAAAV